MELVVDRRDSINGAVAHTVHTIARIGGGDPGLMVATSTFESDNLLSGFKAAAVVALLDSGNKIITTSTSQHGWADATWLGKHVNVISWTFQFDPAVAAQATGIAVLHFPDENYLNNIVDFINKYGGMIVKVLSALFGGSDTSSPKPYDPNTGTGGGGGGTGTSDSSSWAVLGEPWKSRAAGPQIRKGTAAATPTTFKNHVPTSITVHAVDSGTSAAISGVVYIGDAAVGHTDTSFTYTWNQTFLTKVDPTTHVRTLVPLPLPQMSVRADGYNPITVPVNVSRPTNVPDPDL